MPYIKSLNIGHAMFTYTINLKGYIDIEDIEVLLNSSKEIESSDKKNGLLDQVILCCQNILFFLIDRMLFIYLTFLISI